MRTRAVRPGFWEDEKIAKLPISARLTYVGLWCIADDAGFFELNVVEIAGRLFMHDPKRAREKRVQESIAALIELQKCGRHAVIPKLPDYRYNAGAMIYTIQKRHEAETPAEPKTLPLGLEIEKVAKARDNLLSESVSESVSESSTGKPAAAKPSNGHAAGGAVKTMKDREKERQEAIARARQKLEDPATSEGVKESARFALIRLGAL
jgi:hypothetical protein